jgi:hypothetical protein
MNRTGTLTDTEKAEIALGAAIGAGCHRCAEKLYSVLVSLGTSGDDLERLFVAGLAARKSATDAMRRTASALMERDLDSDGEPGLRSADRLDGLIKLAAAAGANCASDALRHAERAQSAGAPGTQISVALGIARSVRSKAQIFSDEEIAKASAGEPAADGPSCCEATSGARCSSSASSV